MANYKNVNEQTKPFDKNYSQRFLTINKQASNGQTKIVSPMNSTRGFNYSNAIRSNEKRKKESSISETSSSNNGGIESNNGEKSNFVQKVQEKAVDVASKEFLPPGLRGIGKSIANNVLGNVSTNKPDPLILKASKKKLYLIAGGVGLGFIFVLAIVFSVLSTGGTEASGAGFNEVSEYELENTNGGESATDPDNTTPEDNEAVVENGDEVTNEEVVQ